MLIRLGHYFLILLWHVGLYKFPPQELYNAFLKQEIGHPVIYRYLDPKDIDAFVEHHNLIKQSFEESEEAGLTRIDQLPKEFQEFIDHPLMQAVLADNGRWVLDAEGRRQVWFALNRIDRLIEDDLEKRIYARRGIKNVVKREN